MAPCAACCLSPPSPLAYFLPHHRETEANILTVFSSCHSGSMNQFTAVYSGSGELISSIKYYDGFMGQRVGAISCLAFHPHWVCTFTAGSLGEPEWVRSQVLEPGKPGPLFPGSKNTKS